MFKQAQRAENGAQKNTTTKPGIGVFVVSGGESSIASSGAVMLKLKFIEEQGTSEFNHTFFLTEKAITRLRSLWEDCGLTDEQFSVLGEREGDEITKKMLSGEELTPEESKAFAMRASDDVINSLKGKSVRLKVIAEIKDDLKNNKPEGYTVPTLSFAYFSEPVNANPSKLVYNEAKDFIDKRTAKTAATNTAATTGTELPF